MVEEEKSIRFTQHMRDALEALPKAGEPVYRISSAKGRRLVALGFLVRPDLKGPYYVTSLVAQTLENHPAPVPKTRKLNATERLVDHIATLRGRVLHEEIVEHLEIDTSRGTDTSPKFMRPKGRRAPRRISK